MQALVDEHEDKLGLGDKELPEGNGNILHRHENRLTEKAVTHTTTVRRGVAPGSFIDLLVKRGNTETGQKFSKECIVQQASLPVNPFLSYCQACLVLSCFVAELLRHLDSSS